MRNSLLLIITFSFAVISIAQEDLKNVLVLWKVGDEKLVTQTDSNYMYKEDTLLLKTGVKSSYKIKVVNLKDSVYEIQFSQTEYENPEIESQFVDMNEAQKQLSKLFMGLQSKLSSYEYTFYVHQSDGQAFSVKDKEKQEKQILQIIDDFTDNYLESMGEEVSDFKKQEYKDMTKSEMRRKMPELFQTMLNSFNYVFQVYSIPFVLEEEYSQRIDVYDVNQFSYSGVETAAIMKVTNTFQGDDLSITYSYDYDKEDVLAAIIKTQGKGGDIDPKDLELEESTTTKIELNTGWVVKSKSHILMKIKDMKMYNVTHVQVK